MRTGIVLAGGRSSRFGSDKLVADFEGRALLAATIEAVTHVVDRVLVAGPALPQGFPAGAVPVSVVRDREPLAGPLAALANVLGTVVDPDPLGDLAIVVGGDMPRLVPEVLQAMLDRLDGEPAIDAVLLGPPSSSHEASGPHASRRAVLPLAVRLEAARGASAEATEAGERSLRAILERLAFVELPPSKWLLLDPAGSTLLDVDTEADLARIRGR
jgi:molybdopterin-guanine dinucleotide biosynthesis protein A